MNKGIWLSSRAVLLTASFMLCLGYSEIAFSQYACVDHTDSRQYDNPCPLEDDVEVPMPANLSMVFRVVRVPGGEFWGNPSRNIEMGDPQARMFEGPRLVSVAGSFPDDSGDSWSIIFGKYEVSVAQYAAVLGAGDIRLGIEKLAETGPLAEDYGYILSENATEDEVRKLLASPIRGLRASELERFTRMYTDWCYENTDCIAALPSFGSMPGFFRLPTETEWEFAARRHEQSDTRVSFLPFDENESNRYAYISTANRTRERPTSIGRMRPTSFGIHDLYGNVSELVDGRFYSELGQGKPGMYVSRGESFAHSMVYSDLRPSARSEVQSYRKNDSGSIVPLSNVRLGMRLAIGSQTVPDLEMLEFLQIEYANYRSTDRLKSAAGKSTQATVLNTVEPLNEIDMLLEEFSKTNSLPADFSKQLSQLTQSARVNLVRTSETLAGELAERASTNAAEAGRALFRLRNTINSISILKQNNSQSAKRIVSDLERKAKSYDEAFTNSVRLYQDAIARLASYRDFAMSSIDASTDDDDPEIFRISMSLLREHTEQILEGGSLSTARIVEQFKESYDKDSIFEIVD